MSLAGIAAEALLLLGVGAFVVYEVGQLLPNVKKKLEDFWDSITNAARAVADTVGGFAGGVAKIPDYAASGQMRADYELGRHPNAPRDNTVLTDETNQQTALGRALEQDKTVAEQKAAAAAAAAARAKESDAQKIKQLQADKADLQRTKQPYLVDLDTGEHLTLDLLNQRLAALGAT